MLRLEGVRWHASQSNLAHPLRSTEKPPSPPPPYTPHQPTPTPTHLLVLCFRGSHAHARSLKVRNGQVQPGQHLRRLGRGAGLHSLWVAPPQDQSVGVG